MVLMEDDSFDACAPEVLRALQDNPVVQDKIIPMLRSLFRREAQLYFRAASLNETLDGDNSTWTIIGLASVFEASRDGDSETFHSYEDARAWIEASIKSWHELKNGGDPACAAMNNSRVVVEVDRKPGDDEPEIFFKAISRDTSRGGKTHTWTIQNFRTALVARSTAYRDAFKTFRNYEMARTWVDESISSSRARFEGKNPGSEFPLTIEVDIKPEDEGNDSKETA